MIRHLTNKDIILTKRSKKGGEDRDKYIYSIDHHFINYHIQLNSHSNKHFKNYHEEVVKRYELPAKKTDEEGDEKQYIFLDV